MRDNVARHAGLLWRVGAGTLGLFGVLSITCCREEYKFVRSENPQPELEIRINGHRMDVRSAILFEDGPQLHVLFFSRGVNCDEEDKCLRKVDADAVEVGIWTRPDNITGLMVGGKSAGRTIREPKVAVTVIEQSPPTLWAAAVEGTLDVATSTLEIRGKFHARGCGADVRVLGKC